MSSAIPMKGRLLAVALTGALVLLSSGPAHAVDYDVNNLPTLDAKTLSAFAG